MKTFTYRSEIFLSEGRDDVFAFFADAANLEALTPPWLSFKVLTPAPIVMGAGTLIDYKLRVRGFPLRWRTHIKVWEPPLRFVDEQWRGPYRQWIHEHTFEKVKDGTRCRDSVHYAVWGGRLIDWLIVRRDVRAIFAYRRQRLQEIFAPDRYQNDCHT